MDEIIRSYGGKGIDTKVERDIVNYRPDLAFEKEKIFIQRDLTYTNQEILQNELSTPMIKAVWESIVDLMDTLKDIESRLSEELKELSVPVVAQSSLIQEAADKFGESIKDMIPFSLYKKALNGPDSLHKQLILDAFESYQTDVHGNLKAEVYSDIIEMMQDWEDMLSFVNMGLFKQVSFEDHFPKEVTKENEGIRKIHELEVRMSNAYVDREANFAKLEQELAMAYRLGGSETTEYREAHIAYQNAIKAKEQLHRKMCTKNEATKLVSGKVAQSLNTLAVLGNVFDYNPYEGENYDNLYHLIKQYTSGQSVENGLRKLQTILKLLVDGKSDDTNELKENLRNLSGRASRQKANVTLANSIHIRNEVQGDLLDTMNHFNGTPSNPSFELLANHIVDGLTFSDQLYKEQSGDFYKSHSMEGDLRKDKVYRVLDKDSVRQIYQTIDLLITYAEEKSNWPNERNLSSWLTEFMKNKKLD